MKKIESILLVLILLLGFVVRLYRFTNPIADWHSWRQTDTSAVSRNFIKYGYDVLHPRYNDISNVQTGYDNPNGYRFVEFPLFNIFQAGSYQLFDHFSLEEWGRLITILASLLSITFIFLLGKRYGNTTIGLSAAVFYAIVPYSIYYSRVILPDPSMVTAILGGIYFFDLWSDESIRCKAEKIKRQGLFRICLLYYVLAVIFTASAFLLRPYAAFFTLPFIYIAWRKFGISLVKNWKLYLFTLLSLTPLILWRLWEQQYPEGIPVYAWLLNGNHIRFTGAFFYWIFAERISKLILGYWGIVVILAGFLNTRKKDFGFFLTFLVSSLLYITVIATGNVQHDYYQILIIPTLAFLFGLGTDFFLHPPKEYKRYITYPIFIICSVFIFAFGWYQVRDYFNINNPAIVTTGNAVDKLVPQNAKVIAPLDGDTTFLYYTNRQGWPSYEKSPEELVAKGADYLVLIHPSSADFERFKNLKIVFQTQDFVLFNLHK